MKNTFEKEVPKTPGDGAKKSFPASRALEQVEPVVTGVGDYQDAGRLQTKVAVGKKPMTKMAAPHEIEGLRPSEGEMKNG